MAAVGNGVTAVGAGSSNSSMEIYYNGQQYFLPLFDVIEPEFFFINEFDKQYIYNLFRTAFS